MAHPRGNPNPRGLAAWPEAGARTRPARRRRAADHRLRPQLAHKTTRSSPPPALERTMTTWEFACSETIDANVSIASGTVSVTTAPTDVVTVEIHKGKSNIDDDQLADD